MKAKPHTPGPLEAIRTCGTPLFQKPHPATPATFEIIALKSGPDFTRREVLARIDSRECSGGAEEAEANARLFAAAPDLLRALKAILDLHRRDKLNDKKEFENGWCRVFDAIYLATGDNPIE